MSESENPKDPQTSRLKGLATVIAASAALATALGAYFKPTDHSATRASYEELSKVMKDMATQADKDHDELVKLGGFVEGLSRAQGGVSMPVAVPAPIPAPVTSSSSKPVVLKVGVAKPAVTSMVALGDMPPPPVETAQRAAKVPEAFDMVLLKSKK